LVRALALLCWLAASGALALEVPPAGQRVLDRAGLLSPATVADLERELASYETRTGHQLAVLVIPSLEDEALEDYSLRVAEAWKLGSAQRDDGLLLLIAVGDRRARIEVGHGLEGAVTDAFSARLIRDTLGPALAAGRADDGVRETLSLLMRAAEGESIGEPREASRWPIALFALAWIAMLYLATQAEKRRREALLGHDRWRGRRRRRDHVWIEPAGWGGGSTGWGSSGSFSGGGFGGGFSGGGGSFGGGGASGRW
jgi:uncharacterized protein